MDGSENTPNFWGRSPSAPLDGNSEGKNQNQPNIPLGKTLVAIAVALLLLAAARALLCPVPLTPDGMAFVKWTLGTAISVLLGVGIARQLGN